MKCDYDADEITTDLPQTRLSELTGRRRAQMLRRKTRLTEGEARDEGASAELSDMRRRGSPRRRRKRRRRERGITPMRRHSLARSVI